MIRNYLTIALRNLARQRVYAFINIVGLTLGIAVCLLIVLFFRHELSYDRFHPHADDTYLLAYTSTWLDQEHQGTSSPAPLGPALHAAFPEVLEAVRVYAPLFGPDLIRHGDRQFYETTFYYADPSFFDVFGFPLVSGQPGTAFADPYTVVVTERAARTYFGEANPVGQTITLDQGEQTHDFTVIGVLEDLPSTTHFQFDFLASFSTLRDVAQGIDLDAWFELNHTTYVRLREGTSPAAFEPKLRRFWEQQTGDTEIAKDWKISFYLQPLTDVHLARGLSFEIVPGGSTANLYALSAIGLFLLLIACINFTNLATVQFMKRAREVGVRKVVGATRQQLAVQFLGEALLMSTLATILAVPLVEMLLPLFNGVAGLELSLTGMPPEGMLAALGGLALLVGLIAGSYPALFLSTFRPVRVLKGTLPFQGGGSALRKGLVVLQFAIAIVLLVGTAVIYRQLRFVQTRSLGFDQEQVVVLPMRDAEARSRAAALEAELLKQPGVLQASATSGVPGAVRSRTTIVPATGQQDAQWVHTLAVDPDFVETLDMEVAAGRDFSPDRPADATDAILLNEAAVRSLGWDDPLGRRLRTGWGGREGTVIGVVRDFNFASLHHRVGPLAMLVDPRRYGYLLLKLAGDDLPATMDAIETTWRTIAPDIPFEYTFLDQELDTLYRRERQFSQVFGAFAVLTILVACLGLFGLAAFTAERRAKEIGIRKVFGARVTGIVAMMTGAFARLVGVAFLVATPVAYLLMTRWLEAFAYHIDISWPIFLMAGSLALAIALLTISYQAIKAALADPVKSLRYE